jgi:precorrin-6B methylase 2
MSDDDRIWRLLRGFMPSWALVVAVQLGVADALAGGPQRVEAIAAGAGADADLLGRVLRVLVSEGVFVEPERATFGNNDASELLREGRSSWPDAVRTYGAVMRAFGELPEAVRTGRTPFQRAFGIDYWQWLERNPEASASFNRLMQSGAQERVESVAALHWEGETVVDVGGGNGTLLIELLRRHPRLRGIVLDRDDVVDEAQRRIAEAGLSERIDVVAGSFFDVVPRGDAYVLAKVLHDWDDEAAASILRAVRASAAAGSRLVVVDAVVDERGDDDATWTDLVMLALVGGRERTEAEWRALLMRCGFEVTQATDELVEAVAR